VPIPLKAVPELLRRAAAADDTLEFELRFLDGGGAGSAGSAGSAGVGRCQRMGLETTAAAVQGGGGRGGGGGTGVVGGAWRGGSAGGPEGPQDPDDPEDPAYLDAVLASDPSTRHHSARRAERAAGGLDWSRAMQDVQVHIKMQSDVGDVDGAGQVGLSLRFPAPSGPGGASAQWYKEDLARRAERFCVAHGITRADCGAVQRSMMERARVLFGAR
jgi:hypothetical protein